jgi:hypothetical protein
MEHIGLGDLVKIDHMGMTARGTVVGVALGVGRCDILLDEQNK